MLSAAGVSNIGEETIISEEARPFFKKRRPAYFYYTTSSLGWSKSNQLLVYFSIFSKAISVDRLFEKLGSRA